MAATGPDNFGTLLRRARLSAGLTQEALAERAGVSARAVSDLERHPDRLPRLDSVALLADALRLDADARARFLAAARPGSAPPAAQQSPATMLPPMPRPLTPLIGRDGVATAVSALLRRGESRLLTLTGPGGVGKTRLALAVAERVADAFPDGVAFVDLAPLRDPALVLPTIARRLGLDERDATPAGDRLVTFLRAKRLLLILDNFEHLVPARDALLPLLGDCPGATALVTSRVALRVRGEREYRVAPLELPALTSPEALTRSPAGALFLARARDVGADLSLDAATAPAVAAICRRLDGLPLALELAAAWARLLAPAALLARLERRLSLLVGGAHDLPTRQRTMRDAIAWSYDLLEPPEQRLFRRLSIFVGGFTPHAAAKISGEDTDDVAILADLRALADRSLLHTNDDGAQGIDEPRLILLETLREYGLEQLGASNERDQIQRRHAEYFLALAETAEPELRGRRAAQVRAGLAQEHDNLRAALRWSLDSGEGTLAVRLAGALAPFWLAAGHLGEGYRWLDAALARVDGASASPAPLGKALTGAALLAIERADFDAADRLCAQAVALARDIGDRPALIAALNAWGLLARKWNRYDEAVRRHGEARGLAEAGGDESGLAGALLGLAYVDIFVGDLERGGALAEESITILRATGDVHALGAALIGMAAQAAHTGDHDRAERYGAEALAVFRGLGDTGQVAETLWVLGVIAQFREQDERAATFHEENLAIRRARGDAHGAIQPLSALGTLALWRGDPARARALLEETLVILRDYDDHWARAMSLCQLGHVELADGNLPAALARLTESVPLFYGINNLLYLPWTLEGLARVAALRERWDLAARLVGARDALTERLGVPLPPTHPPAHAATLAALGAALGDAALASARAIGATQPLEALIAEAIAGEPGDAGVAGSPR